MWYKADRLCMALLASLIGPGLTLCNGPLAFGDIVVGGTATRTFLTPATTTAGSSVEGAVWFNIFWTEGGSAGFAGYASSGDRTFSAHGLCGLGSDNPSYRSCP